MVWDSKNKHAVQVTMRINRKIKQFGQLGFLLTTRLFPCYSERGALISRDNVAFEGKRCMQFRPLPYLQ
jgi:hypothetical protein